MPTLQTLYRLLVMGGTAVVATMAWQLYGPPVEQLRPLWNRARETALDYWNSPQLQQLADGEPAPFDPSIEGLTPLAGASSQVDSQVAPVAGWSDIASPADGSAPDLDTVPVESVAGGDDLPVGEATVAAVVERLKVFGVEEYSLTTWGTSSGLYRFRCSTPWGAGGIYHRHFEAISADPGEAAQRVLADVSAWQATHTGPPATQIR
jgi:hypothetical protein